MFDLLTIIVYFLTRNCVVFGVKQNPTFAGDAVVVTGNNSSGTNGEGKGGKDKGQKKDDEGKVEQKPDEVEPKIDEVDDDRKKGGKDEIDNDKGGKGKGKN